MADRSNIYAEITDRIIEQLEDGVAPWRRPWASIGGGLPANVTSHRPYRGVNVLLLWSAAQIRGFDSNLWGTFRQWQNIGGHVNRGEKGTKIVFWSVITETSRDAQTGEETEDRHFFARQYTVFNLEQCGGESLDRFRVTRPTSDFTDFGPAEEAIAATGADIRNGGSTAFYRPTEDFIQMPNKRAFDNPAAYYSTTLHELVHWTGHESRLNRLDKLCRFGDQSYATEELVAELGASFLTACLGVPNAPIQDNAAYLKGWLEVLRSDSRAIFTASTAATAAADFILSFSQEADSEATEKEESIPF